MNVLYTYFKIIAVKWSLRAVLRKLAVMKMSPLRILVQFIYSKTHKSEEQQLSVISSLKMPLYEYYFLEIVKRGCLLYCTLDKQPFQSNIWYKNCYQEKPLIKIPSNSSLKPTYYLAALAAFWASLLSDSLLCGW